MAAPTLGNVTAQEIRNVTTTPVSGSFSHNNNGDAIVVIMLALDAATASTDADYTATYNGTNVPTQGETETGLDDDIPRGEILYLASAASGSNTLAWEFDHPNGGQIDSYIIIVASVIDPGPVGAILATPFVTNDTSNSPNINVEAIDSLIIGAVAVQGHDAVPFTAGSAYTFITNATDLQSDTVSTNSDIAASAQSKVTTATGNQAFDMSWSAADGSCFIAIEIKEAVAAEKSTGNVAINGTSSISIDTQKIKVTDTTIVATSEILVGTQKITPTNFIQSAQSQINIAVNKIKSVSFALAAQATIDITPTKFVRKETSFALTAQSTIDITPQKIKRPNFTIAGEGTIVSLVRKLKSTNLQIQGDSAFNIVATKQSTSKESSLISAAQSNINISTTKIKTTSFTVGGASTLIVRFPSNNIGDNFDLASRIDENLDHLIPYDEIVTE